VVEHVGGPLFDQAASFEMDRRPASTLCSSKPNNRGDYVNRAVMLVDLLIPAFGFTAPNHRGIQGSGRLRRRDGSWEPGGSRRG
jgi:hypothetical protein